MRIDVAQVAIYAFWIFFAGLVYYLRREDHREGYPLTEDGVRPSTPGFPRYPGPKRFIHRPVNEAVAYGTSADSAASVAATSSAPPPPAATLPPPEL